MGKTPPRSGKENEYLTSALVLPIVFLTVSRSGTANYLMSFSDLYKRVLMNEIMKIPEVEWNCGLECFLRITSNWLILQLSTGCSILKKR